MAITVQPITPTFGAEVGDVVLGRPLAAADLADIRAAFTKYAVLVFPDQHFDDDSQLDFARNFGPLETTVFKARKEHKLRLHENMADVGNLDAEIRHHVIGYVTELLSSPAAQDLRRIDLDEESDTA